MKLVMKLVPISLLAVLSLLLLASASAANAATPCPPASSAGSDLSVSVSGVPATATRGQTINLTETVTGPANQAVTLSNVLQYPSGKQFSSVESVGLDANGQYVYQFSYKVDRNGPKGTYTLTVCATDASGTASTSASTVVQ